MPCLSARFRRLSAVLVLGLIPVGTVAGTVTAGTGFEVMSFTIDCSGGPSFGPMFDLHGTIGQPDATPTLTSASFELTGGFWVGGEPIGLPCPWDCAPSGGNGNVNIDDLLMVINGFGSSDSACDNSPDNGDGTYGNGTVNIDDLLGVINNFGSCPDASSYAPG